MRCQALPRVAITGADGQVGRALLQRMPESRYAVVAMSRKNVELPADEHIVGPLDAPAAQAALGEAEYIVHLAGALRPLGGDTYRASNLETSEAVARAVRGGRARRVTMLSFLGATADSPNPYLRTKALAERALTRAGTEVVVLRSGHIIGPPDAPGPTATALQARDGRPVVVFGCGRQLVAPVYLGDVVSALLATLNRGPAGAYDLVGPDAMTMDDLVRMVNNDREVRIRHVPSSLARLLGRVVPSLPGALVDVLLRDTVGDDSAAQTLFGLQMTNLCTVWSRPVLDAA